MPCNQYKKSVLDAYNLTSTTYTAGQRIVLSNAYVNNGQSISFVAGNAYANIIKSGVYKVDVIVNGTASAAGAIGIQIYRNGVLVPGASATETATGTADIHNLVAETIIDVNSACSYAGTGVNTIPITVQVTAGMVVTSAKLIIVKLA